MKIAYFTDTYAPEINGVTNTLGYLTTYLQKRGIDHLIFAPDYEEGKVKLAERNVVRFKGIRPTVNPASRLSFPNYRQVLQTLADFQPDVVHIVSELDIGWCGLRAARALDIPVVMSYHTNFDQYLSCYDFESLQKLYWKYMAWFHSFAALNLCPSADTMGALRKQGIFNLELWSRGVDLSQFGPSRFSASVRESLGGRDRTLFLYAGRIAREKSLDTLAKAIRIMHSWYGDQAGFVFAGDGPYLKELMEFELPNTVFTGFLGREELSMVYASCDVFVFPSGTETFGNVVLEAMASGLPVVCANSGGVTDFASHLDNAYLFGNRHIMGLAQAMSLMLSSPALRESIQKGGLQTARDRSWNGVFDALMTQYECARRVEKAGAVVAGRKFA
jgi:glycosyltransferase involved in cell wall biosynthesis